MRSRHDHLAWMHRHFAGKVVTGSELLAEIDAEAADVRDPQQPTGGTGSISGPGAR
jgi:hypothetical protein